jgi:hypothetical protein
MVHNYTQTIKNFLIVEYIKELDLRPPHLKVYPFQKFKCKKPHSNYIGSELIDFNLLNVISKHNNLNTIKLLTFYCTN